MKLLIMSDLHFEWMDDHQQGAFWLRMPDVEVDGVVLAGDISNLGSLERHLLRFVERYPKAFVVLVPGNHEYYGHKLLTVRRTLSEIRARELLILDGKSFTMCGRTFHCATLWFRNDPMNQLHEKRMTDFSVIKDFRRWVYAENEGAINYLWKNVQRGDVVVTHHLPSEHSIHAKYKMNELNRFFVCDMDGLIANREPALWIHGHTHESMDYVTESTRVVCNPYGYSPDDLNPAFDFGKVVEI